jgi:hypothetical protein
VDVECGELVSEVRAGDAGTGDAGQEAGQPVIGRLHYDLPANERHVIVDFDILPCEASLSDSVLSFAEFNCWSPDHTTLSGLWFVHNHNEFELVFFESASQTRDATSVYWPLTPPPTQWSHVRLEGTLPSSDAGGAGAVQAMGKLTIDGVERAHPMSNAGCGENFTWWVAVGHAGFGVSCTSRIDNLRIQHD